MLNWPLELNKSRMVLLVALLFTALGAGVFRTPPILFMAAVLCGAPLMGSLVGRLAARNLRLKRQFPQVGTVGDKVVARLTVSNTGSLPALLVHCRSEQALSPTKKGRRPRYDGLLLQGEAESVVPILLPGATAVWEERWQLTRRGIHELASAGAGALDPLGLYSRLGARTPTQQILVLPRALKIGRLGWNGSSSGGTRPPVQAARVADAADFHGIRVHHPGEGLRRVHWKSTARTGQLHVIEWEEEIASDLTLLLDVHAAVHAGPPGEDSLEALVTIAASIATFLLESGHRFGMMWWEAAPVAGRGILKGGTFKGKAAPLEPLHLCRFEARNVGALETMLSALAKLQPCHSEVATLAHLVEQGLPHVPLGQGTLLITTELADIENAMARIVPTASSRGKRETQTLILDAASFAHQRGAAGHATSEPAARSKGRRKGKTGALGVPAGASPAEYPVARSMGTSPRRLRCGDSIVAALERGEGNA